jgi:hypothetical protein
MYLVLLYQLKACNLKITLSVRGSKATKRACMARGRTPEEAWMWINVCKVFFF